MPRQSLTEPMAVRVDDVSASVTYVGEALVGTADSAATWRIKRITITSTITDIKWADGNQFFDNIWDNRTSLTYS